MKKISVLLVALLSAVFMLSACQNTPADKSVTIIVPNGSPAIAVAKLISETSEIDGIKLNFNVVEGPSTLAPALLSNEAQISILPTNLAAKIYNEGGAIKLVSVNVHGSVYLVSAKGDVTELSDLVGKTVYSVGQTGTPDIVFKYLLAGEGIEYAGVEGEGAEDKVTILFGNQLTFAQNVINGTYDYAIISEPMVSAVRAQNPNLNIVMDLNQMWGDAAQADGIPQASMVARSDVFTKYPRLMEKILELLQDNTQWVKTNLQKAHSAITGISNLNLPPLTAENVDRSNIFVKTAKEHREQIEFYFGKLLEYNNSELGGKLPDDGFYYIIDDSE